MVVHDETIFFNARVLIGLYLGPPSQLSSLAKPNWAESKCTGPLSMQRPYLWFLFQRYLHHNSHSTITAIIQKRKTLRTRARGWRSPCITAVPVMFPGSTSSLRLKKTYKRGGSTVIWKCSWGYKIAPQNKSNLKLKIPRAQKVEWAAHTPKSGLRIVLR